MYQQFWHYGSPRKQSSDSSLLTSLSPESTSSNLMSILPSRRSTYRSWIRQPTRAKCEFTHFVKVFFWTISLSSGSTMEIYETFNPFFGDACKSYIHITSYIKKVHTYYIEILNVAEAEHKKVISYEPVWHGIPNLNRHLGNWNHFLLLKLPNTTRNTFMLSYNKCSFQAAIPRANTDVTLTNRLPYLCIMQTSYDKTTDRTIN